MLLLSTCSEVVELNVCSLYHLGLTQCPLWQVLPPLLFWSPHRSSLMLTPSFILSLRHYLLSPWSLESHGPVLSTATLSTKQNCLLQKDNDFHFSTPHTLLDLCQWVTFHLGAVDWLNCILHPSEWMSVFMNEHYRNSTRRIVASS